MIVAIVFALLVLLLAALAFYSRSVLAAARASFPPIGKTVQVDGIAMHYVRRGAGRPVVLLHSSDRVLQDFTMSVEDHLALHYDTVAFDRPGHGYSGRPVEPLSLGMNARLLRDALRTIPVPRPVLVGHGVGAAVAMQFAVSYPAEVAALVLLSPLAFADDVTVPLLATLAAVPGLGVLIAGTLLVPVAQAFAGSIYARRFAPAPVPPEYTETIGAFAVRRGQFAAAAEERRRLRAGLGEMASRYREVRVPVVIVAGEQDRVVAPARQAVPLQAAVPHARLVLLPDVGHQVHYQRPDAVVDAVHDAWDVAG